MSKGWKHTLLQIMLGLLLTGVLVGAYILGVQKRSEIVCTGIHVEIEDSTSTRFVTEKDIIGYLDQEYKGLIGIPADSVDLYRVETILNSKNAILNSQAHIAKDGILSISIVQRKPAMLFQGATYGFYSTADGFLLPLQLGYEEEVLVIDGYIPIGSADCSKGRPEDPEKIEWLDKIVEIGRRISESPLWKNRIARIECASSGELTIIPKEGRERFLFGHPEDIEEKFEKARLYYERITADKGHDAYDIVDLRYRNQIVCKDTESNKKR